MVVVHVESAAVMDRTGDAGKSQCSLILLPSPSSFRSRVWSRAAKASALGGVSLTLFSSFQTLDTRLCAAIVAVLPCTSSDLLACTSRTTCVTYKTHQLLRSSILSLIRKIFKTSYGQFDLNWDGPVVLAALNSVAEPAPVAVPVPTMQYTYQSLIKVGH
jgi:hypothetical protein